MAECQLSILGEDAWYVHEEKQDKIIFNGYLTFA